MTSWRAPADHTAVGESGTQNNRPKIGVVSVGSPPQGHLPHEEAPACIAADPLGFGDAVILGGNDDVAYGTVRLGSCVRGATEGATNIFRREEGAGVRVGKETPARSWFSLTFLLSLVANAPAGWWRANPIAALFMRPWLVKEGIEGVPDRSNEPYCFPMALDHS